MSDCNSLNCKTILTFKNRIWYDNCSYCNKECIKKNFIVNEFDEMKIQSDKDVGFKETNSVTLKSFGNSIALNERK